MREGLDRGISQSELVRLDRAQLVRHVTRRRLFQWFTLVLLTASVWTAYANVFSDDADVRTKARSTVNHAAGCWDDCKVEGLRGERGMMEERIEYDVVGHGHYAVVCRRAFFVAGDYTCALIEGNVSTSSIASAPSTKPSSAPGH